MCFEQQIAKVARLAGACCCLQAPSMFMENKKFKISRKINLKITNFISFVVFCRFLSMDVSCW
jgi:hypothetical protein